MKPFTTWLPKNPPIWSYSFGFTFDTPKGSEITVIPNGEGIVIAAENTDHDKHIGFLAAATNEANLTGLLCITTDTLLDIVDLVKEAGWHRVRHAFRGCLKRYCIS